ncbi:MAG: hypothetical protein J0L84_09595 [Verrucomicrobia bacterium]|nr:hypothetical protein [Verrucomicrobiota bacterium]
MRDINTFRLRPFDCNRHRGDLNVAFADGRVQAMPLRTLFEDSSDGALRIWNRDNQPHRERVE